MHLPDSDANAANAAATPEQARCQVCSGGTLRHEPVKTAMWHQDRLVVIEDVPALVCQSCGERYYEDEIAMGLDMMRGRGFPADEAARTIAVPVFSYKVAAGRSANGVPRDETP